VRPSLSAAGGAFPAAPAAEVQGGPSEQLSKQLSEGAAFRSWEAREGLAWHIGFAVLLHVFVLVLEPSLKSLLSLNVPPEFQGRAVGLMATIGGLGGMGGNVAGTQLYAFTTGAGTGGGLVATVSRGAGGLPFALVSGLLALSAAAIATLSPAAGSSLLDAPEGHSSFGEHQAGSLGHGVIQGAPESNPSAEANEERGDVDSQNPQLRDLCPTVLMKETSYDPKLD